MWFKYLIPLALCLGVVFYIYYTQTTIRSLTENNVELRVTNEELQTSLTSLKTSIEQQVENLNELNQSLEQANQAAKQNLEAFEDSDLNALSNSKPNLIEKIINDGTRELFEEFERETR